jgi:hypothetical protein
MARWAVPTPLKPDQAPATVSLLGGGQPAVRSGLLNVRKRAGLRLLRSPGCWCPFWLWVVWARWAWDLWFYRLLRTAVPGWVVRRSSQCMDASGRDGTRITQDLDFEVARSAAS